MFLEISAPVPSPASPSASHLRVAGLAALALAGSALVAGATSRPGPRDIESILSRAIVLHQAGDLEGAAALYVLALRAAPDATRVRSNLGAAYAGLGRYDDAIAQYRRALEDENDTSIRRNLALALQSAGRIREAAGEARRVLEAEPENRDALLILADCSWRLGESQTAIDLLAPLAEKTPDDKGIAYLLGTALLDVGRTRDAMAIMDHLFRDGSPEGHVLMGIVYSRRHDWAKARAELDEAARAKPGLPLVNYLKAQALIQAMDWEGAKAALGAELAIAPNHFESNLLLGNLLREEGRNDEALELLERALQIRPDDLAARYSAGTAHLAAGWLEEARDLLEAAAQAAPGHLPVRLQLAILYTRLGDRAKAEAARAEAVRLQGRADAHPLQGALDEVRELMGRTAGSGDAAGTANP